jgi:hypothetical protein
MFACDLEIMSEEDLYDVRLHNSTGQVQTIGFVGLLSKRVNVINWCLQEPGSLVSLKASSISQAFLWKSGFD